MDGIIVINKPKNYTSFDVVAVMRKLCGTKKIGHAGTLDPMATGVLPVLIGKATKVQNFLQNSDKAYRAKICLGITTDTDDITGKVFSKRDVNIKEADFARVLNFFKGEIDQVPPMYSALKKDGVRLYQLARQGVRLKLESRHVTIYEIEMLSFDEKNATGEIFVRCSKGTYIRSLCRDIGKSLGCGAALSNLERTSACAFSLEESITLDKARVLAGENQLEQYVIPVEKIFNNCREIVITAPQAVRFKNGGSLLVCRTNAENVQNNEIFRVYDDNRIFLGLVQADLEHSSLCRIFSAI